MPTIAARSAKPFTSAGCYGNAPAPGCEAPWLGHDRERDGSCARGRVTEVLRVTERHDLPVGENYPVAAAGVRSRERDRVGRAGAGAGAGHRAVEPRVAER